MPKTPHVLVICDGFGVRRERDANAVLLAKTPALDRIRARYPSRGDPLARRGGRAHARAHGQLRGRPHEHRRRDGSSSSRSTASTRRSRTGRSSRSPPLRAAIDRARERGRRLHLIGLVSDGGVHSHEDHVFAILEAAAAAPVSGATASSSTPSLDGRDTPPSSALEYLARLERAMARLGVGSRSPPSAGATGRWTATTAGSACSGPTTRSCAASGADAPTRPREAIEKSYAPRRDRRVREARR